MSHWNYRVLQSYDGKEYFVAEVYYDDNGYRGWVDKDILRWDNYTDLKGTVELVQKAFERPLLRVGEGDELYEVTPAGS